MMTVQIQERRQIPVGRGYNVSRNLNDMGTELHNVCGVLIKGQSSQEQQKQVTEIHLDTRTDEDYTRTQ